MNDHPWPSLTTTTTSTSSPPRISTLPSRATFYQSQRRQESDSMKDHLSSTTITASSSTSTSSASATPQSKQHTAMRPVRGEFDLESVKNRTLSVSTATVSYTTASTITSAIPTYPTYQETTTGHKSDSDMEYHRKLLVPTTTTSSTTALTPNFPSRRATYQTRSSPESDVVNGQMLPAITTTIITTTSSSLTTSNNTSRVTTEQIQETDSELENDRKFLVPTIETTSTLSQTTTATISSYTRGNPSSHESVSDLVNDRTSDSTTRTISTTPRTATLPSHSHSLEPPNVQEAMDAETLPNTTTTTLSTTSSSSTAAPTTQSMQTSTEGTHSDDIEFNLFSTSHEGPTMSSTTTPSSPCEEKADRRTITRIFLIIALLICCFAIGLIVSMILDMRKEKLRRENPQNLLAH